MAEQRKLPSWIDSFVEATSNLDSPAIFRRWTAIAVLSAAMEQKCWLRTSSNLYPNLFIMAIGHPGVGKTRTIDVGRKIASCLCGNQQVQDFFIAPLSMTFAALVDHLQDAHRYGPVDPETQVAHEWNSTFICAHELGAFISKYDNEMIDGLSAFYDHIPYQQKRRGNDINISIANPQVTILAGSTPQNLLNLLPERAWGQGFMSRMIMVFSDERIIGDDFAPRFDGDMGELRSDLRQIHGLYGRFHVTSEYRDCVNNWRQLGEPPVPNHPKLTHYITRRRVHLYKLSMVSSVDRGSSLALTREDFNRAMNWLTDAEAWMPEIFKAGATNVDGAAMDEIQHFITANDRGTGVIEQRIVHFARERVPIHSILRIIEIMEKSGMIHIVGRDKRTLSNYYSTKPGTLQ